MEWEAHLSQPSRQALGSGTTKTVKTPVRGQNKNKLLKVCVQAKEVPNPQTMDYTGEKQKLFLKKEKELVRESYGFT